MLDTRSNCRSQSKEMELGHKAMEYVAELRGLGRATTPWEVGLSQSFRWNIVDGGWVFISHSASEPTWYSVPSEFRGELGERILVAGEGYFRRLHEQVWEKLRVDRNTRHFETQWCPSRVPSYRFANSFCEKKPLRNEDVEDSGQYLTHVLLHEVNVECENCTALLEDYLFGIPCQGDRYSQGLFTKLSRMAARGQKIHRGTIMQAISSMLKDKRRSWGKFTRVNGLGQAHGYTDPRDIAIVERMAFECGCPEPASWQGIVTKVAENGLLPICGEGTTVAQARGEVLRRVNEMRRLDSWFEKRIYEVLMERDARFSQISIDDVVSGEIGSRTYAEVIEDPSNGDGQEVLTVEEVGHLLKDAFFAQMDTRPTESPRNLMRRALLHVEREIEEAGFAHSVWSDAKKESLLTLAREWWTQGREQARQLGLER